MFLAAAGAMIGGLLLMARCAQPNLQSPPPAYSEAEIHSVLEAREARIDPDAEPPVVIVDVDYDEGPAAPWFPKGESPLLKELVDQGLLPPVEERVGPEPVVMQGAEGVGNYGGTWYRIANAEGDLMVMRWGMGSASLARWSPHGYPIRPHLARHWEVSEDLTEYIVHLRRGTFWSDGHPFTARDLMYWWEHEVQFFDMFPRVMAIRGELGEIEMIDLYTVRFRFPHPNGIFPEWMATESFWSPEHYLRDFHPEIGDPEKISAMMSQQNAPSARTAYFRLKDWRNPEHPQQTPWVLRQHQRTAPYAFVRNPYYPVVDVAGNQLPYIDRIVNDIRTDDMIAVTVSAGDVSMQHRHVNYEDHALYMANRESGDYEVYYWVRDARSVFTAFPNLNRRVDPDQPETKLKHELLNDRRFRQALSLAVDRKALIRAQFDGIGEPAQIAPPPESPFYHPGMMNAFIAYDPAEANRLLDEIGLDRRDEEGYRTFKDGSRMTFFFHLGQALQVGPAQFMIDDWRAVGVRVIMRLSARNLWQQLQSALEQDITGWGGGTHFPLVKPRQIVPTELHSFYAPGYAMWYLFAGMIGSEEAAQRGRAIEPPLDHPLRRAMVVMEEAMGAPDIESQRAIFNEAMDIAASNTWHISIATPPPLLAIVKNGFRGVPRSALVGWPMRMKSALGVETFYFDKPHDSESARAQIQQLMLDVEPDPRRTLRIDVGVTGEGDSRRDHVAGLIRFLIIGILLAGAVLILVRHPFITRRIVILMPTVVVISVCVFTIIELPPGDFITARIMQLEMEGDAASIQEAEELRDLFHLDESAVMRYVRWTGLPWFISFDSADLGLLQGDLGRSMEDGQRVNDIVGDRIRLTLLISLFTLLFTWAVAIPIGLYSAVRQYSIGDYVFTFIGFIGMCVPPMLLALVMMYVGSSIFGLSVGGLFSPEYALQPEWTWGKFVDLLQHIWIPVLVLGVTGTAGMIRVLRANMLDELGKPYVTTARAKGVRPVKLILKYPLRLALNPFISGIGMIFPQLVSGGAIVGIVLSLPTVGPLLLSALQAQNMYLAGSMLMVLSLLTVFGTLVSDLLLMWVDPRIRMGGKA